MGTSGRLATRKWTDQQGIERYTTEVIVDMHGTMQILDSKPDQAQQPVQQSNQAQQRPQQSQQAAPPDFDDSIPFNKYHSINGI